MLVPRAVLAALARFGATRNVQDASTVAHGICQSEAERLDSELSMLRYIAWAIPAIGFIGTVRGIGDALSQAHKAVTGDISGVTEGLGVAFNSTLIALLLSILLMFLLQQLQQRPGASGARHRDVARPARDPQPAGARVTPIGLALDDAALAIAGGRRRASVAPSIVDAGAARASQADGRRSRRCAPTRPRPRRGTGSTWRNGRPPARESLAIARAECSPPRRAAERQVAGRSRRVGRPLPAQARRRPRARAGAIDVATSVRCSGRGARVVRCRGAVAACCACPRRVGRCELRGFGRATWCAAAARRRRPS